MLKNLAACGIQQQDVVGKIVGHQKFVRAIAGDHCQSCGIRNGGTGRCLAQAVRNGCARGHHLRGNSDEALGHDSALTKTVNCYAIAGVARPLASGVGDRADGSVEVTAVGAECQSQEITLMGIFTQAIIRKVGELIGLQIDYHDRLPDSVGLGTIAVIE